MIKIQNMKKYILSTIAMALGLMSASAQTVSVDDVTIKAGETKVVSINLNNTQTNIVSFQMDLALPEGISVNKAGCTLGSRITDTNQELTIGKQPDGSIRFTSTSLALNPITGSSGEIIKLSLTAAKDAKGGTATLKKIIFATSNSQTLTPTDVAFKVNVPYTLTYKVDGEVYKNSTVTYGSTITPEAAPKKEGYTFSGWSEIPKTMPAKDVVVTGSFTINKYKLTYMVDGEVYKTSTVPYGSTISPEAAPTKEGYTFSGWSEIPKTMPAKDVVVTGSFTINKYKLTYMVDGVVYKTYEINYAATITPEAEPTKEGYTFSGWSEIPKTMPAKDVVITGSFTINKYKLTYMVDGVKYKSYEINFATAITPEAEPTKEGYTFSGWSEIPEKMPAKDVTVTGTFAVNSYTLTYMVDGEVYKTFTVTYGSALTPEAAPKKEGYTFLGWSGLLRSMPAHDVVVTGSFTINKYKLTYMVDAKVYRSFTVKYGDSITPLQAPTKEGYTFSGWDGLPESMPAKDIVVRGSFTINSYTITYVLDGVVYTTETLEFKAKIVPPVIPGLEDYVIWEDVPATMPAKNIIIYGKAKEIIDGIGSIHNSQFIIHNEEVYDLSGHKMFNGLKKGINIIRMSDGTSRKVLIK